jgi:D-alanyl-D-alanine dipeptidase
MFERRTKHMFFLLSTIFIFQNSFAITQEARSKGFVYLHEIDPTIIASLRYATNENFVGKQIVGYKKPVVIVTKQAAQALKKVQDEIKKDGYSLVVYDAYRPQRAVDCFVLWAKDAGDQAKKAQYYPRINKADAFDLGYIAKRSGHSRGSTVDLTLIKRGTSIHAVKEKSRKLLDGYRIAFLDDGTVDMGSSFDLFDEASHYENNLIGENFKRLRTYLKSVMEKYGFKNYSDEWWHFTLQNEPFPAGKDENYFDFVVE